MRVHDLPPVLDLPPPPMPMAPDSFAELADGTLTWCTGPKTLAEHTIPTITAAADAAGRPAPRVIAAIRVAITAQVP